MKFFNIISLVLLFTVIGCKPKAKVSETTKKVKEEYVYLPYSVTLKAHGNEPGWTVVVTDTEIKYTSLANPKGFTFSSVQSSKIMDAPGIGYSGKDSRGNQILVQAFYEKCADTMEDKEWPCRVTVDINMADNEELDISGLSGCGEYEEDSKLAGVWEIETFNGREIEPITEKVPAMAFALPDNTLRGNMGCNVISGSYNSMENTFYFNSNFSTTIKYCEEVMSLEKEFYSAFSGKALYVNFTDELLVLTNMEGKIIMTLKLR
ncbi:MAG: META domain-containing protein [Salibacteraceae bacterium]